MKVKVPMATEPVSASRRSMQKACLDDELIYATIGELSAKLRHREVSSVELTTAYLNRLELLGPKHNALALSLRKPALKKAKAVDSDIKIERFRGPLQGIPFWCEGPARGGQTLQPLGARSRLPTRYLRKMPRSSKSSTRRARS